MVYSVQQNARGLSLGTTLVAVFLVVTAAMAVSALGFHHTNFATRVVNAQHAQNLAESALSRAVERLRVDRSHTQSIEISHAQGSACVVFDPEEAQSRGVPRSTNNLEGGNSVEGDGGFRVPAEAAHLVARATIRGVTREAEALVSMPKFPYVIASSGSLRTRGDLLVASVSPEARPPFQEEDLLPGDLVANGTGSNSLMLGTGAIVSGSARASGGVKLLPEAVVRGEVLTYQSPVALPILDLRDFDPGTGPGVQQLAATWLASPVFSGSVRCSGDAQVSGGLTLDGGILYVAGDLKVQGGVRGTGALIVEGSLSISGPSDLASDNKVALLCGGDAVLTGSGRERSFFRGLVYTQGDLWIEGITLIGSLVANNPLGSAVDILDSSLLADVSLTEIALSQPGSGATDLYFRSGEKKVRFLGTAAPEESSRQPILIRVTVEDAGLTVTDPSSSRSRQGLTPRQALHAIEDFLPEGDDDEEGGGLEGGELMDLLQQLSGPEPTDQPGPGEPGYSFDFNQFIAPAQRMRIVLWRLR